MALIFSNKLTLINIQKCLEYQCWCICNSQLKILNRAILWSSPDDIYLIRNLKKIFTEELIIFKVRIRKDGMWNWKKILASILLVTRQTVSSATEIVTAICRIGGLFLLRYSSISLIIEQVKNKTREEMVSFSSIRLHTQSTTMNWSIYFMILVCWRTLLFYWRMVRFSSIDDTQLPSPFLSIGQQYRNGKIDWFNENSTLFSIFVYLVRCENASNIFETNKKWNNKIKRILCWKYDQYIFSFDKNRWFWWWIYCTSHWSKSRKVKK